MSESYFVDSSALVKRYVVEPGTAWVRRLTRRSADRRIYLARITTVEVTAAVARRRKGRTLTATKAQTQHSCHQPQTGDRSFRSWDKRRRAGRRIEGSGAAYDPQSGTIS